MRKLVEASLAEYAKVAGPEPQIDPWFVAKAKARSGKPVDLAAQHRAWAKWWLDWYEHGPRLRTNDA